jgi:hypothetical protein
VNLHLLNELELTCFFLNVYHTLLLHALVLFGPPQKAEQRRTFFTRATYIIGGLRYSLSDIENGVLRGNAVPERPAISVHSDSCADHSRKGTASRPRTWASAGRSPTTGLASRFPLSIHASTSYWSAVQFFFFSWNRRSTK